MRRVPVIVLLVLVVLLTSVGGSALAAAGERSPYDGFRLEQVTASERERVLEVAERDARTRELLALRHGGYDVDVDELVAEQGDERAFLVRWTQDGHQRLEAIVDESLEHVTRRSGQSLTIMPGRVPAVVTAQARWYNWVPLTALFVAALVTMLPVRAMARTGFALGALTALVLVGNLAIIPSQHVWGANVALFGAASATLLVSAAWWLRASRAPAPAWRATLPTWGYVAIAVAAVGWTIGVAVRLPMMVDVGYASDTGARLIAGGATVYGNVYDVPGFLHAGDTYGPAAYLAYVVGALLVESSRGGVVATNLVLLVAVAAVLLATGVRQGSLRRGARAAAVWCACPIVALSAATGTNDVVVGAAFAAAALLVLHRPGWAGAAIGVAAAAKYLPIVALVGFVAIAPDRRSVTRMLGGATAALVALFAIGLRGGAEWHAFYEAAIARQATRDDIGSLPGLLGLGGLRAVAWLLVAASASWLVLRRHRLGSFPEHAGLLAAAGVTALVLLALPQYYASYVTWLVPLLLAAELAGGSTAAGPDPGTGTDPVSAVDTAAGTDATTHSSSGGTSQLT